MSDNLDSNFLIQLSCSLSLFLPSFSWPPLNLPC